MSEITKNPIDTGNRIEARVYNIRIPLEANTRIVLNDTSIICEKCIGRGSTCLVYSGHISDGNAMISGTEVIIKEFYPLKKEGMYYIHRDNITGKLSICQTEHVEDKEKRFRELVEMKAFTQFMQGIENQKILSKSDALEIAIKPWMEGWWGDSYYVVCDVHRGKDLHHSNIDTLEKKFLVAIGIAEALSILHASEFLLLDMKPENLMWIEQSSAIRIMDVDSLMNIADIGTVDKVLFSNMKYASPEIEILNFKLQESLSESVRKRIQKEYLQKDSNYYSLGKYLWELFFMSEEIEAIHDSERLLDTKVEQLSFDTALLETSFMQLDGKEQLLSKFVALHSKLESYDKNKLGNVGECLIDVLSRLTIDNRTRRRKEGYLSAEAIMKDLNEIYVMLTSKKYMFRKEIAKANGTFAAYHLLQEYPLFWYCVNDEIQSKRLEVVLIGAHAMRRYMLSASISIGQMLDTQLHIYLVAPDAELFWSQYLSNEGNPGLRDAVVWSANEHIVSDVINPFLVARPLAHIHLMNGDVTNNLKLLNQKRRGRYFIVLEEDIAYKKELCHLLYEQIKNSDYKERCLIAYLQVQEEASVADAWLAKDTNLKLDFVPISMDSFSELYNEKMYESQIYKMGLMAYAYYRGFMEEDKTFDIDIDMEVLEKEFKEDLYGIASSERAALHSMYKIASLGISRMKPGRFLNYYRKLEDEQCLERLSWLEHLSWTAYILTSGGIPIFTKAEDFTEDGFSKLFDEYAYRGKNDWKDKRDEKHLRHPFLVAYHLNDCLKPEKGWLHEDETWPEEKVALLDPLDILSYRLNWWYKKKISCKEGEEVSGLNIDKLLRDAYKERDIKQSDRDMVFAAVDMIV